MPSISDPRCCGFMKVVMFQLSVNNNNTRGKKAAVALTSSNFQKNFNEFSNLFGICDLKIDYDWYRRNEGKAKSIMQNVNKASALNRQKLAEIFGKANWLNLSEEERKTHQLFGCPVCKAKYRNSIEMLVGSKKYKTGQIIAKKAGFVGQKKVYRKEAASAATSTVKELDKEYKEKYNITFEATLKSTEKVEIDKVKRKVVQDIENQWKKTSVLRFVQIRLMVKYFLIPMVLFEIRL